MEAVMTGPKYGSGMGDPDALRDYYREQAEQASTQEERDSYEREADRMETIIENEKSWHEEDNNDDDDE